MFGGGGEEMKRKKRTGVCVGGRLSKACRSPKIAWLLASWFPVVELGVCGGGAGMREDKGPQKDFFP